MKDKGIGEQRTSDEIALQRIKKTNSPKHNQNKALQKAIDETPDSNRKFLTAILAEREMARNADVKDISTLYACLQNYLKYCLENGNIVTNMGAYAACGVTNDMVRQWKIGRGRAQNNPDYKDFAFAITNIASEYREMAMGSGKINPIVGIWWQKIYDGYREDTPQGNGQQNLMGEQTTADEVANRYDDMPD